MTDIPRCRNGHPLTADNIYPTHAANRTYPRCRTCVLERKRKRYRDDEQWRRRQIAYSRWFKCGDPWGRSWPEIRASLFAEEISS